MGLSPGAAKGWARCGMDKSAWRDSCKPGGIAHPGCRARKRLRCFIKVLRHRKNDFGTRRLAGRLASEEAWHELKPRRIGFAFDIVRCFSGSTRVKAPTKRVKVGTSGSRRGGSRSSQRRLGQGFIAYEPMAAETRNACPRVSESSFRVPCCRMESSSPTTRSPRTERRTSGSCLSRTSGSPRCSSARRPGRGHLPRRTLAGLRVGRSVRGEVYLRSFPKGDKKAGVFVTRPGLVICASTR